MRLLGAALSEAKILVSPAAGGVDGRALLTPRAALIAVVNERSEPATRRMFVDGRARRSRRRSSSLVLVDRKSGRRIVETSR